MDSTDFLPNDLSECQRLLLAAFKQATKLERRVVESEQQVADLNRVLGETAASYQELQQEHAATLDELAWYKRWAYGRRRERFREGEGQGHLFDLNSDLLASTDLPELASSDDAIDVQGHRRRRQKREIDWDKLPQIRHEHDLPEEEKICSSCGRRMDRIGEDVTRELELQPAKLEAHIHVRPKYACRCCKEGVCAAPLPQRPIPGGIAGPGLVAEVIVSKFGDHLPLYRLEDILVRYGVYIPRSTLCDWVKFTAELFKPLYELERQRVLQSAVMWTDDTSVTVLGGPQGSFQGNFWTYIGHEQPYSVYDFTKSRTRDGPASFLRGFAGYTEDGRLTIDNNVSERTLRHQAIGRKNWLFLGSEAAGPRAAVLCTILAGAKRHRIEPWCYVRDLLLRLHADDPRLDEMLPDRWAAAHPEAVLNHRLDESRAKAARTQARRAHRRARCQ